MYSYPDGVNRFEGLPADLEVEDAGENKQETAGRRRSCGINRKGC